jgi:hypothetical protein
VKSETLEGYPHELCQNGVILYVQDSDVHIAHFPSSFAVSAEQAQGVVAFTSITT